MSSPSFEIVQIKCSKCKKIKSSKIIPAINVVKYPGYKNRIFDGSLFKFSCPGCGYKAQIVYNFLYHDPKKKLLIGIKPKIPKNKKLFQTIKSDLIKKFPNIKDYTKRIVSNIEELKEKILIFDNGLNDKVIEQTKLSILDHVSDNVRPDILDIFFCMYDKKSKQISFLMNLRNREKYYYSINTKAYEDIEKNFDKRASARLDRTGFLFVKLSTVKRILD